ncbi:MAG TPA: hydroxyacylglutathione hydrolase [Chromatiales bacterium]|nr:hydroxyacylglutathione hydrolase [Chromatiales bacterium]
MRITPLPAFDDNYMWLLHDGMHEAAVVDPGDARPVIEFLEGQGLRLSAILLTHHHWDHVGGARELAERYGAPVYGPHSDQIDCVTHPLEDGETLDLGRLGAWRVMATPGHTLDHIAYYAPEVGDGVLFCGDTLFGAGCGRLFEGTPRQMQDSLEKIRALPEDTLIYCGHEYTEDNLRFATLAEPDNAAIRARIAEDGARRARGEPTIPSTLALEKATNPFLRWDSPELRRRAETRGGQVLAAPDAMFASVRAWKDAFDAGLA